MSGVTAWVRAARTLDLFIIAGWGVMAIADLSTGHLGIGFDHAAWALAWWYVADLLIQRRRCPLGHGSIPANSAVVTAAVEPSSDMRQAARSAIEIRTALIAAGYTPEQASRQIADMIAANGQQQ